MIGGGDADISWACIDCPAEVDDGGVYLLPQHVESPLWLEGSAFAIWVMLMEERSLGEVCAALADEYDEIPGSPREAVLQFCGELERLGLIVRNEPAQMRDDAMIQNVLTVCTGNVCRSVFAEKVLSGLLEERGLRVNVASAGTSAGHGKRVPREIDDALGRHGYSCAGHEPTQLGADAVAGADLILTATVEHRDKVLQLRPAAMKRTFTFLEAAAAAKLLASGRSGGAVSVRALARARSAIPSGTALDIEDPFGGPAAGYEKLEETMLPALEILTDFIGAAWVEAA